MRFCRVAQEPISNSFPMKAGGDHEPHGVEADPMGPEEPMGKVSGRVFPINPKGGGWKSAKEPHEAPGVWEGAAPIEHEAHGWGWVASRIPKDAAGALRGSFRNSRRLKDGEKSS